MELHPEHTGGIELSFVLPMVADSSFLNLKLSIIAHLDGFLNLPLLDFANTDSLIYNVEYLIGFSL